MMKFLLFIFLSTTSIFATNVYVVDYEYQADLKVFVVEHKYQAELLIYKTEYKYQADKFNLWYFVEHEYQADLKIFFTEYSYQADLKVYFVDHKYQAELNKKFRTRTNKNIARINPILIDIITQPQPFMQLKFPSSLQQTTSHYGLLYL